MRRWTSAFRFEWTPIVNFASRRLRFLDWVDDNVDVQAFNERTESVGIAVGHVSTRLIADGQGFTLSDGTGHGVRQLGTALNGLFTAMSPSEVLLTEGFVVWSEPLDRGFDEACAALASQVSSPSPLASRLIPADCAMLVDYQSESWTANMEWGIVDAKDLGRRLAHPKYGRMPEGRPSLSHEELVAMGLDAVSFFADTRIASRHGLAAQTSRDAETAVDLVVTISEELAQSALEHAGRGEMQRQ